MPILALMGNKIDLNHMQAVKSEQHEQFAKANGFYSFYVSAKSGDQVSSCFYKLAADLAGVEVTKPLIEVSQKQVKAEIVQHTQNEESEPAAEEKLEQAKKKESKCLIF